MALRVRDWQSRLAACLAERMARPFAWGSHDCVMFAADCVEACTGVDPAAGMRGTYKTATGAARVLKRVGGMEALAAEHLGPEVPPLMAQPGDVGIVRNAGVECFAVWTGSAWHAPAETGLTPFPHECALRVWRVEK